MGNLLLVGNIRYGVFENGTWNIKTIYRQSLPSSFVNAIEMHGMCLLTSEKTDTIRLIGQELKITGSNQFPLYTCGLVKINLYDSTVMKFDEIDRNPIIKFQLCQNFPNPFNPTTTISYQLPSNGFTTLKVYDVLGREAATLVNELKNAGTYFVQWNASQFTSGVYFAKMTAGSFSSTKKLLLMK